MTTGEGGAVAVGSEEEWALLKSLSNQGRSDSGEWLTHARLGYNYRLDDLSAALGLAQLERLDEILAARAEVAARYGELLAAVDGVEPPLPDDDDHRRSWFVYVVKLAAGSRPQRRHRLGSPRRASRASRTCPSIHLQPFYRERFGYREGMLPVSEDASARTLALPFHARLPAEDQERVVEALRRALS